MIAKTETVFSKTKGQQRHWILLFDRFSKYLYAKNHALSTNPNAPSFVVYFYGVKSVVRITDA